jgi:predicted YcjX-like family ATPase
MVDELIEQIRLATKAITDFGVHLFDPTIRLGVTGLSHAGKTVFITALIHGLVRGGRFPIFEALAGGRIARAYLAPQPDDAVSRFDYENHIAALVNKRDWPSSTRQTSELRVVIEFQSLGGQQRKLTLDIVDYPGEWLLDLPLLTKTYESWASETIRLSRQRPRSDLAKNWHLHLATLDPHAPENEQDALAAAHLFTEYLRACRDQNYALSLLPPGRFLMPGDLANTPALTFAPLELPSEVAPAAGSLWAMMRRRYESYRAVVVRPFFRNHFARLDRQIVLVDTLAAINAGPEALGDLEHAINEVLTAFEVGRRTLFSALLRPRIDRVLLAATKADHLHHTSHDRLENILRRLAQRAISKAEAAGAQVDVVALSAVRATREATARRGRQQLPCVVGVPLPGEAVVGEIFDGETEVAIFPGDLPDDPNDLLLGKKNAFRGLATTSLQNVDFRFLRVRPPALELTEDGVPALPHIRLDRALQFLIGDKFV